MGEVYNDLEENEYSRCKSWEFCKKAFQEKSGKILSNDEKDALAKELAIYLASFGMYVRDSFILNCNYTIHKKCVEIVTQNEYAILYKEVFDMDESEKEKFLKAFQDVYQKLKNHYKEVKRKIRASENISMTLLTKILLGVFGCCVAYDTRVREYLRNNNIQVTKYRMPDLNSIITYVRDNIIDFDDRYNKFAERDKCYTKMRVADIIFWEE